LHAGKEAQKQSGKEAANQGTKKRMEMRRQRAIFAGRPVDECLDVPEGRHIVAHPDPVGVGILARHNEEARQGRHIQ